MSRAASRAPLFISSRARSSISCRSRRSTVWLSCGSAAPARCCICWPCCIAWRVSSSRNSSIACCSSSISCSSSAPWHPGPGLLQLLLQIAQLALGHRQRAVLDEQRQLPQQVDDRAPAGGVVLVHRQSRGGDPQAPAAPPSAAPARPWCRPAPPAVAPPRRWSRCRRQLAPLLDDRARQRMAELARRQHDLDRGALAVLADRVDRLQLQHHGQAGERMGGQVLVGAGLQLGRLGAGLEQRQPLDLGLAPGRSQQQCHLGHAVIVLGLEIDPQDAAVGRVRLAGERDGGDGVGHDLHLPACDLAPGAVGHRQPGVGIELQLGFAAARAQGFERQASARRRTDRGRRASARWWAWTRASLPVGTAS